MNTTKLIAAIIVISLIGVPTVSFAKARGGSSGGGYSSGSRSSGVSGGIGTEELCARLKRTYPEVQITAGGGVRGIDDVRRLVEIGVDRVLVASALHDGRITLRA